MFNGSEPHKKGFALLKKNAVHLVFKQKIVDNRIKPKGWEDMNEKRVVLNGNSFDILNTIKKSLISENFEQFTTYGFDFEYGIGYLTVFEKYFFRNESVASLTLHIHPLEHGQVELIAIISGSSAGILKIDWGVSKSVLKMLEKLIEELN